jgi:peptidylprolyl isomerase
MAQAKQGDRVSIHFTGTLADGTVFDSTYEGEDCGCDDDSCDTGDCGCDDDSCGDDCGCESGPMELTLGAAEFFPQIEAALVGMAPGEKKSVTVLAADAFGEHEDEKVFTVGRDQIPDDLHPEVGQELVLTDENDESMGVTVVEVSDVSVTFDANHPLAGEDLTFEIELVEIH